jgi:hypothetical protein
MAIFINGKKSAVGKPGTYVLLSRKWQNGDRIEFKLPIGLKATTYSGYDTISNSNRFAFEYGPILLALTGNKPAPHVISGTSNLMDDIIPDATKPLRFSIRNNTDYQFLPYFSLEPDQNFTVFPIVPTGLRYGSENR